MDEQNYSGPERRRYPRADYVTPLDYKICKETTIAKLLSGYTANISDAGILCHLKEQVNLDDILWMSFDRDTLQSCEAIEKHALIYQNGIIGKVVRVTQSESGTYCVGVQFITREEQNQTHIYPRIHFIMQNL